MMRLMEYDHYYWGIICRAKSINELIYSGRSCKWVQKLANEAELFLNEGDYFGK